MTISAAHKLISLPRRTRGARIIEAFIGLLLIAAFSACFLHLRWRSSRRWVDEKLLELTQVRHTAGEIFTLSMVSDLPELVQRYFLFSIKPGARLSSSAELDMSGTFSFGPGKAEQQLRAHQVICAPLGMIWKADIRSDLFSISISGSDGVFAEESWTQFALNDLIPIVQIRSNKDHYQSAVGRMLAEAVFWTPSALLVSLPVMWESDENLIRAIIEHNYSKTVINIRMKDDGCPTEIWFQRWTDANPEKTYQYQPFGGVLSKFKQIDGITIPTHVEAGNFFGTLEYVPFYKVDVQNFRWLD